MLKALELSGFKSFADRTRFEFPRGISVVVGPNGSGKSNVVDAVKWVLGAQSAKSLRGKEMADVIFNGCAIARAARHRPKSRSRSTIATASWPIDAREVHVTRRVYRSGEGEYLINRQPCRLRDIRELLAGTGITTEAYCIIEQGKVDVLLQSSPRDRRVIFEEAAGISQFKAKKATAAAAAGARRAEPAAAVGHRRRSRKPAAQRAVAGRQGPPLPRMRRRGCSICGREVGLVDWRAFTKQIAAREAQLAELDRRHAEHEAALAEARSAGPGTRTRSRKPAARAPRDRSRRPRRRASEIAALEAGARHRKRPAGPTSSRKSTASAASCRR